MDLKHTFHNADSDWLASQSRAKARLGWHVSNIIPGNMQAPSQRLQRDWHWSACSQLQTITDEFRFIGSSFLCQKKSENVRLLLSPREQEVVWFSFIKKKTTNQFEPEEKTFAQNTTVAMKVLWLAGTCWIPVSAGLLTWNSLGTPEGLWLSPWVCGHMWCTKVSGFATISKPFLAYERLCTQMEFSWVHSLMSFTRVIVQIWHSRLLKSCRHSNGSGLDVYSPLHTWTKFNKATRTSSAKCKEIFLSASLKCLWSYKNFCIYKNREPTHQ